MILGRMGASPGRGSIIIVWISGVDPGGSPGHISVSPPRDG